MNSRTANTQNQFFLFADLNCPFGFALNERMESLNLSPQVEWRGIQRDKNAKSLTTPSTIIDTIAQHIKLIQERAPDVVIKAPIFRPNTALAMSTLIEMASINKSDSIKLRGILYRAYWHDSADISNPSVLQQLLKRVDTTIENISQTTQTKMVDWQIMWEEGAYDQKIPAFDSKDYGKMVGLPTTQDLLFYLSKLDIDEDEDVRSKYANSKI